MVSDGAMYDRFREAPRRVSRSCTAGTTSVGSGVAARRGMTGAVAHVKYLRRALRICDGPWSETDEVGTRYRIRLSRLDFPQLGVDRVALRYSAIGRGAVDVIGHAYVVLVRVGNTVTIVTESRSDRARRSTLRR